MLSLVEKLREIDNVKRWFVDNASFLIELFGEELSENSDFTALKNSVEQYKTIRNMLSILNELTDALKDVEDSGDTYNKKFKFLYNGIMTDWDNVEYSLKWALIFKDRICIYHNIIHFYGRNLNRKIIFYTSFSKIQPLVSHGAVNHNLLDKNAKNCRKHNDIKMNLS